MAQEFRLPDLGEGIAEAQIVRVMIKPGDTVEADQYLMEVETDKAAVEIPSPYSGIASAVHVKAGQVVQVGTVIVTIDEQSSGKASPVPGKGTPAVAPPPPAKVQTAEKTSDFPASGVSAGRKPSTTSAAPAVRKLAREKGIDIDSIAGSGPGGRVTREDLENHLSATAATPRAPRTPARKPPPTALPAGIADSDKWGPTRRVPLNQIRKTIAAQMSRSAFTIPHVTHVDEADITDLDRMRRGLNQATGGNPNITPLTFVIRATCLSIAKYPIFNASFDADGGQIIYKNYINIGIAVDSERGLIVPVIRDADKLSLEGIASALRSISEQIRQNQFSIEDLRGGTFTITNVGALGGMYSTPIINYPEVAILALGRSRRVPVIANGQVSEALKLPLCLSFDHRATDGADAARFTGEILSYLQTPGKFLLD